MVLKLTFLRQGLSVSPELMDLARLADQRAPGMCQFSPLQHKQTEALQGLFCYVSTEHLNSGPQTFMGST